MPSSLISKIFSFFIFAHLSFCKIGYLKSISCQIGYKKDVKEHKIDISDIVDRIADVDSVPVLIIHNRDLKNKYIFPYHRYVYSNKQIKGYNAMAEKDKKGNPLYTLGPRHIIHIPLEKGKVWVIIDWHKYLLEEDKGEEMRWVLKKKGGGRRWVKSKRVVVRSTKIEEELR